MDFSFEEKFWVSCGVYSLEIWENVKLVFYCQDTKLKYSKHIFSLEDILSLMWSTHFQNDPMTLPNVVGTILKIKIMWFNTHTLLVLFVDFIVSSYILVFHIPWWSIWCGKGSHKPYPTILWFLVGEPLCYPHHLRHECTLQAHISRLFQICITSLYLHTSSWINCAIHFASRRWWMLLCFEYLLTIRFNL